MGLNTFLSEIFKEIIIDDAGWGDLILGVVIGALEFPSRRYMERRISVSSFQPPNFEMKRYLDDALESCSSMPFIRAGALYYLKSFLLSCRLVLPND